MLFNIHFVIDAGERSAAAIFWNVIFDLHDVSLVMADNNSKIAEIHLRGSAPE